MLRGLDHVFAVHCKRGMFSGGFEEAEVDDGPGTLHAPRILNGAKECCPILTRGRPAVVPTETHVSVI